MKSFLKIIPAFLFIISALPLMAQNKDLLDVRTGFNQYALGKHRSMYNNSISPAFSGEFTWNVKTERTYVDTSFYKKPYLLKGVAFVNALFTFYEADTLVQINLYKLYTKRLYADFEKLAKKDFKTLTKYLKAEWGKKGKGKEFHNYKNISENGFEWVSDKSIMWLSLYEDTNPINPSFSINLIFK